MRDQRIELRPFLGGEDGRDREVGGGVAGESVDRLGRHGQNRYRSEQGRGVGDRGVGRRQNP
jgi:hypothetical protein